MLFGDLLFNAMNQKTDKTMDSVVPKDNFFLGCQNSWCEDVNIFGVLEAKSCWNGVTWSPMNIKTMAVSETTNKTIWHIMEKMVNFLQVNLINMVREPVSRAVSNFYFVRNPRRWQGREVSWVTFIAMQVSRDHQDNDNITDNWQYYC